MTEWIKGYPTEPGNYWLKLKNERKPQVLYLDKSKLSMYQEWYKNNTEHYILLPEPPLPVDWGEWVQGPPPLELECIYQVLYKNLCNEVRIKLLRRINYNTIENLLEQDIDSYDEFKVIAHKKIDLLPIPKELR